MPANPRVLRRQVRRTLLPVIILSMLSLLAPYARAQQFREGASAPVGPLADLSRRAWELAGDGKVSEIWQQVKSVADDPNAPPAVTALRQDIALHEQHSNERQLRLREEYERKLAEVEQELKGDQIIKALASAVEAYGLAEQPADFLQKEQIARLIATAEKQAAEHEAKGDWLKALSLYRGLELLFERQDRYSEPLKRVAKHVSLLRLYAPEALFELYKAEALERGDEAPEPWNLEDDHWNTQLEGIEPLMMAESLALGARQHIEGSNFEALLIGGIDSLLTVFHTKGMETAFAALADPLKTGPFVEYLQQTRAALAERKTPMSYTDASSIVRRLMDRNAATVKLPESVIVHEMGDGAMGVLDDFSSIIWPHQKARFERTTRGEFSGVGIQISQVNRQLTVVTPLEDTPAHRAHIRSGDQITAIDGKTTVGMDLDTAVDKITGVEGTLVTLGIKSPGDEKPRSVELVRESIKIVSVKGWERKDQTGAWNYYIDPALKLGYVRMTGFGPQTADELDAAVEQMKAEGGINGMILDLRFNPGGRLDAAVEVSDRFLDHGTIVSTSQKLLTGRPWSAEASAKHTYENFPVIVLINQSSASASEIVAGALQDHNRALIVGDNSFGKGSVQNLFRIGGERAYLKLTTQYYMVPSGRIIHRRPGNTEWGIAPDVTVKVPDKQVAQGIQARMLLDVLRDPNDPNFDPKALMSKPKQKGEVEQELDELPPIQKGEDILTHGLDPQLETALLLLKTRLLGEARG